MTVTERFNRAAMASPRPTFLQEVVAAGARHGASPVCVHRTPLLLSERETRAIDDAAAALFPVLRHARDALLSDLDRGAESLAARIGVPLDAVEWASIDPGFRDCAPVARLDSYVVDAVPRFLELNAESPAGIGYAAALAAVVDRDPAMAILGPTTTRLADGAVVAEVASLARKWGIAAGAFTVAIVDEPGVATAPEFDLLAASFRRMGHPTLIATPDDAAFDGEALRFGGERVDVLFRRFLVCDVRRAPARYAPILAACRARRVCMVNSMRTALLHCKGLFALLHDPSFPLSDAYRRVVSRHIPYTALLDDRVCDRIRNQRDAWVLKPIDAHGGRGVVLGWRSTQAEWDTALNRVGAHVAQSRVPAPTGAFFDARDERVHPRLPDLGVFLVGGKPSGFLCRLAEGELANVSAGSASQVPVYTVSDASSSRATAAHG